MLNTSALKDLISTLEHHLPKRAGYRTVGVDVLAEERVLRLSMSSHVLLFVTVDSGDVLFTEHWRYDPKLCWFIATLDGFGRPMLDQVVQEFGLKEKDPLKWYEFVAQSYNIQRGY
jgi:hypothetical protein